MLTKYSPEELNLKEGSGPVVFLGGGISTAKWRKQVKDDLGTINTGALMNPIRKEWLPNINKEGFSLDDQTVDDQTKWELKWMSSSDIIFFYLTSNSKNPMGYAELSQLALAMTLKAKKIVYCSGNFAWTRYVENICEIYGVEVFRDFRKAREMLKTQVSCLILSSMHTSTHSANALINVTSKLLATKKPRKKKNSSNWFKKLKDRLYAEGKNKCVYCNKILTREEMTMDHVHPRAKGGREKDLNNLVVSCEKCNVAKSDSILKIGDVVTPDGVKNEGVKKKRRRRRTTKK